MQTTCPFKITLFYPCWLITFNNIIWYFFTNKSPFWLNSFSHLSSKSLPITPSTGISHCSLPHTKLLHQYVPSPYMYEEWHTVEVTTLTYLDCLFLSEHRATRSLYLSQSLAILFAPCQLTPISSRSSLKVLRHVFFGFSFFLLPSSDPSTLLYERVFLSAVGGCSQPFSFL